MNITKYKSKSLPALKKRAKFYFNKYIRLRDTDENGYGTCISSGQPLKYGTELAQAGHYFSGGHYPILEFNEDNVHLQGKSDNYFKSGNQLEYRTRLIKKIGVEKVEQLEFLAAQGKRISVKHSKFFFIDVIETYQKKCKEISTSKNFKI
jgi:hypothetical protein